MRTYACRACQSDMLITVLPLGDLAHCGHFPAPGESVPIAPLELARCAMCGLIQLGHDQDMAVMYGDNYGYRSGLNQSMVVHLQKVAETAQRFTELKAGDAVLDIGANDGTLLGFFPKDVLKVGIDPTISKFEWFYPPNVLRSAEFFSQEAWRKIMGFDAKAQIVTSIAMFYDLPDPVGFAKQVNSILTEDGAWVIEAAYLPEIIKRNAWDSICHEHLEYYRLADLQFILNRAGFRIRHFEFNATNGGSVLVVAKKGTGLLEASALGVEQTEPGLDTWHFRVAETCNKVKALLADMKAAGLKVYGLGASTKGNTLLQVAGIGPDLLIGIGEVNSDKFGKETPGTHIPIMDERIARKEADAFLVLPWHFRENIILREAEFLDRGGKLIFPLPTLEIVESPRKATGRVYQTSKVG